MTGEGRARSAARRTALAAVAAVLLTLGLSSPTAASLPRAEGPEGGQPEPTPLNVLQLGDSYSSGVGARDENGDRAYEEGTDGTGCRRSDFGYGGRFAASIGADFRNAACGYAMFDDILRAQPLPSAPPQIDAVDEDADVVLVTMGGNDLDFANIVLRCFQLTSPTFCRSTIQEALGDLPALEEEAYEALSAVREQMRPDAKLVVLSYPRLTRSESVVLTSFLGRYDFVPDLTALSEQGEEVSRSVVDRLNADAPCSGTNFFVDTIDDVFAGHENDQSGDQPEAETWIWGLGADGDFLESYHPNNLGYQAMADELRRFYDANVARPQTLAVEPSRVQPGEDVSVAGEGFRSGDELLVSGGPGLETTLTADGCGSFDGSLGVPVDSDAGERTLTARSTVTSRSAEAVLTVEAKDDAEEGGGRGSTDGSSSQGRSNDPATAPSGSGELGGTRTVASGVLPDAGGPSAVLLGLGVLASLAGGATVLIGRRRGRGV